MSIVKRPIIQMPKEYKRLLATIHVDKGAMKAMYYGAVVTKHYWDVKRMRSKKENDSESSTS